MDFSGFNGPEQAHMTKMIEKKQVSASLHASLRLRIPENKAVLRWLDVRHRAVSRLANPAPDARFHATLLVTRREMLQCLYTGFHEQGIIDPRGESPLSSLSFFF